MSFIICDVTIKFRYFYLEHCISKYLSVDHIIKYEAHG